MKTCSIPSSSVRPLTSQRGTGPAVLIIDDDVSARNTLSSAVSAEGFTVHVIAGFSEAADAIDALRPEIVVLSLLLPGGQGVALLDYLREFDSGIDVIVSGGDHSATSAIEIIEAGAYDYLARPIDPGRLRRTLSRWQQDAKTRSHSLRLDQEALQTYQFEGIIGRSPLMLDLFSRIRRAAPHYQTALVTGDTGTGKELVARALHSLSPVAGGPFVVCNCAALTDTLIESELFGHQRGAFTGAHQNRAGLFEAAHGGTLFLDEVSEMPLASQAKLLRAIQNREVRRLGAVETKVVNVRIVAATNRDLRVHSLEGHFRQDLYHRLSMFELRLPRLTDRREDLPLLQRHFLERFAAEYQKPGLCLTRRAQALLRRHHWPGNVRELENAVSYGAMMAERTVIDADDLPELIRQDRGSAPPVEGRLISLHEAQRAHVLHVLQSVGGNRARAAMALGVSRATLYRMLASGPSFPAPESQLAAV